MNSTVNTAVPVSQGKITVQSILVLVKFKQNVPANLVKNEIEIAMCAKCLYFQGSFGMFVIIRVFSASVTGEIQFSIFTPTSLLHVL